MRLIRYRTRDGDIHTGWILEDRVGPVSGDIYSVYKREEAKIPLSDVELLTPVIPGKILAVARNYAAHAEEHNAEVPDVPVPFLKPPSAVIGPGQAIILPPQSKQVEHEAELCVVIGKQGRWIEPEEAHQHILGYTIGNDVTARDLQRSDPLWTRAKGFDTFAPLGPWIETEFDPSDALITCRVNDEITQMASTRDMVFTIQNIIAYISSFLTLLPGDVIMTGTPQGVSALKDGDLVSIEIEGLGILENPVHSDE